MSMLSPQIRSHRALCAALEKQANAYEGDVRNVLGGMAEAHADAAAALEAVEKELEQRLVHIPGREEAQQG